VIADGATPAAVPATVGHTWSKVGAAVAVALPLTVIAARNGAYFPTSWGWAALALGWALLLVAVLVRELAVTRTAVLFVASIGALAAWTLLSTTWSDASSSSALEAERALVYVIAVSALAVVARSVGAAAVLSAVAVATFLASAYGLATRLFPGHVGTFDPVSGYRLASPVGYWNAMGLVAATGSLLALGFLAHGRSLSTRATAAASLVVYLPAMYFTFSRGAWLAIVVGFVVFVALSPARLEICAAALVGGIAPAAVVAIASQSSALTTLGADVDSASREGRHIFVAVVVGAVVATLLGAGLELARRRYEPTRTMRRAFVAVLAGALVAAASSTVVRVGSPWHLAARGWHSFTAPPSSTVSGQNAATGTNLNERLFQLSNNNRIVGWKSAVSEWRSAPVAGRGAGTFEEWWLVHRAKDQQIRDAHSLYLETLGELGLVGLLLVAAIVLVPLVALWRCRRSPYVAVAGSAFVAWAVHAGLDWDWEVPAATLPALACAIVCCSALGVTWTLGMRARVAIGVGAAAVALVGIVEGIGNQALASSRAALETGNYARADSQARKATRWAPWLSEPWIIQGQIQALNQDRPAAQADFRKAIAKDPRNYLAWYGLAGVTSGVDHRRAVTRVLELNPLSDEARELSKGP
jgi:O-antigen ligase